MSFPQDFNPNEGDTLYTMQNLESGNSVKLRAMSDVTAGFSLWSEKDGKPTVIRAEESSQIDPSQASINTYSGKPNKIKQFIAMLVWNYSTERFEIFETDKSSIIAKLYSMDQDPDLGDLQGYDIKLSKTGKNKDTKYDVLSLGKSPVSKEIKEQFASVAYNPNAFFTGDNPLSTEGVETSTPDVSGDVPF